MRCNICDNTLSGEQVSWSRLHQEWEPCPTCLIAISEVFTDPLDEDEITYLLDKEGVTEGKVTDLDTILFDKT